MAALSADSFTISVLTRLVGQGGKPATLSICRMTFGNGVDTYPTGGIPLPARDKFGLKSRMDALIIIDQSASDGVLWKVDWANKKLLGYVQGVTVGTAGAATIDDFPISSGLGADTSVSIGLTSGGGTKYLGALKELRSTDAPGARTMYVMAIGA